MNLVIHGNTLFAWTAAAQMAAQGHSVLLCPAWSVLITVPDDEVLREPGLREAALAQQSAGRLRLGKGVDVLLAAPGTAPVHQHWLAQDAGPRRLQDHGEALLVAACQQASAASALCCRRSPCSHRTRLVHW